jgi:hypothetical protein
MRIDNRASLRFFGLCRETNSCGGSLDGRVCFGGEHTGIETIADRIAYRTDFAITD